MEKHTAAEKSPKMDWRIGASEKSPTALEGDMPPEKFAEVILAMGRFKAELLIYDLMGKSYRPNWPCVDHLGYRYTLCNHDSATAQEWYEAPSLWEWYDDVVAKSDLDRIEADISSEGGCTPDGDMPNYEAWVKANLQKRDDAQTAALARPKKIVGENIDANTAKRVVRARDDEDVPPVCRPYAANSSYKNKLIVDSGTSSSVIGKKRAEKIL